MDRYIYIYIDISIRTARGWLSYEQSNKTCKLQLATSSPHQLMIKAPVRSEISWAIPINTCEQTLE